MEQILDVRDVSVEVKGKEGEGIPLLRHVSLELREGETVCLVGESGSGKTLLAKTIMRLIDYEQAEQTCGEVAFRHEPLHLKTAKQMQAIRGKEIAMIFQEPMSAFDPVFTIGRQIVETIREHEDISKKEAKQKALDMLAKVKLPSPSLHFKQYPNELSGGMLQRAMIAMALSCRPALLIADEPTTALDVTVQADIMSLLKSLQNEYKMTLLMVTHDLSLAAEVSDRIVVMYAGKIVEIADAKTLARKALHPYTSGLLKASAVAQADPAYPLRTIPGSIPDPSNVPSGCAFQDRCAHATNKCRKEPQLTSVDQQHVACWHVDDAVQPLDEIAAEKNLKGNTLKSNEILYTAENVKKVFSSKRARKTKIIAVNGVSVDIYKGETFGLVGESGSGKSTLGRLLLQLEDQTEGTILYDQINLRTLKNRQLRSYRKDIQIIFQDPYASLDPRWKAKDIVGEPLALHFGLKGRKLQEKVERLLDQVGLNPEWGERYPHQFSGGQRQRLNIARAISTKPRFIVADEAVSALDVSVQAQIINLLKHLQRELGLTYLFISHDLGVVRYISDRIGVMKAGELIEIGDRNHIFHTPQHDYTKKLIGAIPQSM